MATFRPMAYIYGSRVYAFLVAAILFMPVLAWAADVIAVAHVLNGKSFVLATGDTVRLASVEVPNMAEAADGTHAARPGEPLGEEAKAALAKMLTGHSVHIATLPIPRDRHNRLLGQVYREDGMWIEGEMLKEGYAMVYSFSDDRHEDIAAMLAAEHEAQKANRGIWANPYFRVIAPQEAGEFIGRFRLVEGRVVSVNDYHGHIYINFSERWKGNFAVFISSKHADAFTAMNPHALTGKTIRLRGWINYHNAPEIDLTHPEQIEVMN